MFVLDLCAVHPDFQGRGIASKMVRWGLEEAQRRGVPEAVTEGSAMGRHVYMKLGFHPEGLHDIHYHLDDEFSDRPAPPANLFLRTGHRF